MTVTFVFCHFAGKRQNFAIVYYLMEMIGRDVGSVVNMDCLSVCFFCLDLCEQYVNLCHVFKTQLLGKK